MNAVASLNRSLWLARSSILYLGPYYASNDRSDCLPLIRPNPAVRPALTSMANGSEAYINRTVHVYRTLYLQGIASRRIVYSPLSSGAIRMEESDHNPSPSFPLVWNHSTVQPSNVIRRSFSFGAAYHSQRSPSFLPRSRVRVAPIVTSGCGL